MQREQPIHPDRQVEIADALASASVPRAEIDAVTNPGERRFAGRIAAALESMRADAALVVGLPALRRAIDLERLLPRVVEGSLAAAPLAWWSKSRAALANLTSDETVTLSAGLRGGSIRRMEFRQGSVHLDLEVEPVRRSTSSKGIIRGQAEGPGELSGIPAVFINSAGEEAATTTLDDSGFFEAILPEDVYEVAIAFPHGAVVTTGVGVA